MNSITFRELFEKLPAGMQTEVRAKPCFSNVDDQMRLLEASSGTREICDAMLHQNESTMYVVMKDYVDRLRKDVMRIKNGRYRLKLKLVTNWVAEWAKATECTPCKNKENLSRYFWPVDAVDWKEWEAMLLKSYFDEFPDRMKAAIKFFAFPKKPSVAKHCGKMIKQFSEDIVLTYDPYVSLRIKDTTVMPLTLFAENTFEKLVAAFDRVYNDVTVAKNKIHEQDDKASRSVRQKTEISVRFRKDQTLDLKDGESLFVPKCTLTFSGGSLTVSGWSREPMILYTDPVGKPVYAKHDPDVEIQIGPDGVARSDVVYCTDVVGQHLEKYLLLLTKLEMGNFANLARKIATLSRECIFCSRPLTNGDSISNGAGDVCMKRYGNSLDHLLVANKLPQVSSELLPDVRMRTVMNKVKVTKTMSDHAMWVLRSDAHFEGIRECLESESERHEEVERKLFDFVKRITGAENVERACKDLHKIHVLKGRWIPAVPGASMSDTIERVLDAARVAEHFGMGEQHVLVNWISANRESFSTHSHWPFGW